MIFKIKNITKVSMAVPAPTGEVAKRMKEQGIYILQDMLSRMPNTTQKDMHAALRGVIDSGASEFFSNMTPRTVIGLPSIYILDNKDVFEVDNKRYVSLLVEPPRVVGKVWKSPSGRDYAKGQEFEGEITALDLDSGTPVILPLPSIRDKVIKPTENAEEIARKANKEIAAYNEKIASINNAIGADKLVLQVERARSQIQRRLDKLEGIKKSTREQLEHYQKDPKTTFDAYAQDLQGKVERGELSLKDAYDTVLYFNMGSPEKIISNIDKIPEALRAGVLAIARKEVESREEKAREESQKELEQEERIRSREIPEIHDVEIEPFSVQDIPGGKGGYKEVRTPKTLWSHIASLKASLAGSEKDIQELTKIKQSIENIEKYMGALLKGQRSKEFLNTPEGQPVLDAMNNFLNESSLFVKRYATDIVQDGKINTRLMGSAGTEGNAILAVSLNRMYNVVKETIDMYSGNLPPTIPAVREPAVPETVPVTETVVSSSKDKIKRMSELLWIAFENRMKIK